MCDFDSHQIVQMKKIQAEGLELFIKKNADYGNSYKQYGLIGVLVRLQDKINRALHITQNGIHVKDETLRDTLIDLHNYAAMALMESDQNPGSNSEPTVPNLPSNQNPISNSEPMNPNLPIYSTFPKLTPVERAAVGQNQVRLSDPPIKRDDAYEECNHRNINLR
jgi:hypothetical protein